MNFFREHVWLTTLHVFSLIIFSILAYSVLLPNQSRFDLWAHEVLHVYEIGGLTLFMLSISNIFHPISLFLTTLIFFVFLILQKRYALAWIMISAMSFGSVLVVILKILFGIARPLSMVTTEIGPAFPSAHATAIAIISIMVIMLVSKKIHDRTLDTLFAVVMFFAAFLTGISRLYIGVHWFTDVAAGYALGIAIGTFFILLYLRIHHYNHGGYPTHV